MHITQSELKVRCSSQLSYRRNPGSMPGSFAFKLSALDAVSAPILTTEYRSGCGSLLAPTGSRSTIRSSSAPEDHAAGAVRERPPVAAARCIDREPPRYTEGRLRHSAPGPRSRIANRESRSVSSPPSPWSWSPPARRCRPSSRSRTRRGGSAPHPHHRARHSERPTESCHSQRS